MKKIFLLIITTLLLSLSLRANVKATLPKETPFKSPPRDGNAINPSKKGQYTISGTIAAANKSSVSFKTGGLIQKIIAKPGDTVKKGELLAILDPTDYELQLSLAKTNKHQAQIQQDLASNEFKREEKLKEEGASSGSQFDQVEFKYKQARIGVELADINLKIAQRNLDNAKLRAPYNCVVAIQHKSLAERIGAETPIFDLYEVDNPEVHLNAPEVLTGKLRIGSKLSLQIPSVECRDVEVTVTRVVPVVGNGTFKVVASFIKPDSRIIPGLFAEAFLH